MTLKCSSKTLKTLDSQNSWSLHIRKSNLIEFLAMEPQKYEDRNIHFQLWKRETGQEKALHFTGLQNSKDRPIWFHLQHISGVSSSDLME